MTNILVKTNGASITATADGKITSGMIGVPVSIEFDNSWDGLTKTAFFRFGDFVRKVSGISTTTTVPFEVLRFHGKPLEIGIEGRDADGNIVMPTVWASVATVYQGASGDVPAAPNPGSGDTSGGSTIALDTTLTKAGMAADAKAVGDRVGHIETALDAIIAIQKELIGVKLITFYIYSDEYTAEEGMTWSEWVDSKYNTVDAHASVDEISTPMGPIIGPDDNLVMPSDVIIAGAEYII